MSFCRPRFSMRCLQLPFSFDPVRLRGDLALVAADEWIPHINRNHYDGRWSGAALRSLGGSATDLVPEARGGAVFQDTALLARCAYFREVLATLRCPLLSVRLLRLHAGSSIAEHVDHALDFDDGEVRLHVPIVTSDEVKFFLDGARLAMAPGECWYTNVNLPHSVENRGVIDRIHLVIDCQVDAWLRDVFASAPRRAAEGYTASLALPDGAVGSLFETFSACAQPGGKSTGSPRFQTDGSTLVLSWAGAETWQFRLRLGGAAPARLESSPDPERRHRADFDELLARIRAKIPDAGITADPVP